LTLSQAQQAILGYAPNSYYAQKYRAFEDLYLPHIIEVVNNLPKGSALDVGPGWGTMTYWLSKTGHSVTCLDMIPQGHWMTKDLLTDCSATFVQGDVFDPPKLGPFQLILLSHVLTHLKYRADRAIRNLVRMLASDGVLIACETNALATKTAALYGLNWRLVPEHGTKKSDLPDRSVVVSFTPLSLCDLLFPFFQRVELVQRPEARAIVAVCRLR
jgi:2-polyprenyl-3-methyl-5-hydroxy-6-metoxy-1,4-benzoquinol methylase